MRSDLTDRTEKVLEWRREGHTFREIGRRLGVTRQRATQLWQRALEVESLPVNTCWCGEVVPVQKVAGGTRKYCSDAHVPTVPYGRKWSRMSCSVCGKVYSEPRKNLTCNDCERYYRELRVNYAELAEAQGHLCAICGCPETAVTKLGKTRRLSVDHCHATGKLRELLCLRCNTLIGSAKDDPVRLERAAAYLRKHAA